MSEKTLERMMTEAIDSPVFHTEMAVLEFNERLCEIMEAQGVSRAELARRMGKSRAWVTRLLNGSHNMTVATMAEVLLALGYRLVLGAESLQQSQAATSVSPRRMGVAPARDYIEETPEWARAGLTVVKGGRCANAA